MKALQKMQSLEVPLIGGTGALYWLFAQLPLGSEVDNVTGRITLPNGFVSTGVPYYDAFGGVPRQRIDWHLYGVYQTVASVTSISEIINSGTLIKQGYTDMFTISGLGTADINNYFLVKVSEKIRNQYNQVVFYSQFLDGIYNAYNNAYATSGIGNVLMSYAMPEVEHGN
jgi:hypothetical protein